MNSKAQAAKGAVATFYAKHPIISHLILIMVAGFVCVWLMLIFLGIWTDHGSTTTIPDVREMQYDKALDALRKSGLHAEIADSVYDQMRSPGTVLDSWPRAGAVVKPGREVYLTITSFQVRQVVVQTPLIDVPSRQAMAYLQALGINHVRIVNVPSMYADLVVGAKYEGKNITPGMKLPVNALVTLEVGTGETPIEPMGDDYEAAHSEMEHTPATHVDDESAVIDEAVRSAFERKPSTPARTEPAKEQPTTADDDDTSTSTFYD